MSLISRVQNILLKPKEEWGVIDAEPATIGGIYTSYVLILAAIGPICGLIGEQVIGINLLGVTYKPPIVYSVGQAVIFYVMSLVSVYISALVIDALAPSFGGEKNFMQAFKVAAFAPTAAWVAGIFNILPALSILSIVGLYSLYLLFTGLAPLMRTPEDKSIPYTVVVIIAAIVLNVVIAAIAGMAIPSSVRGF